MSGSTARAAQPSLDELRAEALAAGRKPRRFGWWYVTEHWLMAMRAYGWTIVVGALGQPLLYAGGLVLGLAVLIGGPIADDQGREVPYLVFVLPALLMSAAISIAAEEFTYPVLAGFKWRRYFFGFSASPISGGQIATGVMAGAAVRMLIAVVPFFLIMAAFGAVPHPWAGLLTIPVAVLGGLAFGLPLMAYISTIEDDTGQPAMVQRFIVMPLFLFSGTFYPITNLPEWLQVIGWASPLWHASQLGRVATYGADPGLGVVLAHLAFLTVLAGVGYLLARRMFERRLAK